MLDLKDVLLEKEGKIAIVTLNRPARFNSYSPEMRSGLARIFEDIANDQNTGALIITGAGEKAFCVGRDWAAPNAPSSPSAVGLGGKHKFTPAGWIAQWVHELPQITIAAVNGVAAGGGAGLALACDFRIASENARFATAFVTRGLALDTGISYFLPRLVGLTKALEIGLTGDIIDAKNAERLGLVSKVVPAEQLRKTVTEFAQRITKQAPIAVQLIKQEIYKGQSLSLRDALIYETFCQFTTSGTEDVAEGVRSFLEKREPQFTGKFEGIEISFPFSKKNGTGG